MIATNKCQSLCIYFYYCNKISTNNTYQTAETVVIEKNCSKGYKNNKTQNVFTRM